MGTANLSLWCRLMMTLNRWRIISDDRANQLIDVPSWCKHPVAMWHWMRHNQDGHSQIPNVKQLEYHEAFHCECGAYFLHPFGPEHDSSPLLGHPDMTDEQRRKILSGERWSVTQP